MKHPRLTDSQLRDLQPGDRVSRYSRPGEVQTAPVARLTPTTIEVWWPDETVAKYWRESGTRTNCRGEVLRMPTEEPDPRDADPVLAVLAEIATTAPARPARLVVEDVAFVEAAESDDPRLDGEAREWLRSQGHLYHSLPLADAQRRWWERERCAPALPVPGEVRIPAAAPESDVPPCDVCGRAPDAHPVPGGCWRVFYRRTLSEGALPVEAAGPLLHCGGCDVDHESDSAFVLGHPCPMCGWELRLAQHGPSASVLPVELITLSTPSPVFYAALGPLLASSEARKEGVEIWHRPGKTWMVALVDGLPVGCGAVFLPDGDQAELASAYVLPEFRHQGVYRRLLLARTALANAAGKTRILATCTPASAAILARLGFVAIGESAGYTTMSLSAK